MGKSKKRKLGTMKLDHLEAKWNECFSKIHELSPVEDMEPLNNEKIEQYFCDMKLSKDELNETKSLLNNIDIVKWHGHTKSMHVCGSIITSLSRHIKAELVTQAWAKFYTILSTFDFFSNPDLRNITTVHLCEAPGSFVTSLNHYLQSYYRNDFHWNWLATSLNPYFEGNDTCHMIDDDRFIIETLDHWDFGPDFTGNIMNPKNLTHLQEKFKDGSVTLVTADGSTDCSEKPDEQEKTVSCLVLWETITALSILSEDGSFVLKIFTVFEEFTISLIYMLHTLFESVTFIKPGPSKPGNSEVYVVCEKFKKQHCLESPLFQKFFNAAHHNDMSEADVTDTIPKSFMHDIMMYAHKSSKRQIQVIRENLDSFKMSNTGGVYKEELKEMKDYIAKRYLKEFSVYPIDTFVSPMFVWKCKDGLYYNRKTAFSFKHGSYNDRHQSNHSVETSNVLKDTHVEGNVLLEKSCDAKEELNDVILNLDHPCCSLDSLKNFTLISSKKVTDIKSSCFMTSALLNKYFLSKQKYEVYLKEAAVRAAPQEDIQHGYHYELNEINQTFPSIALFQKKRMLFISNLHCRAELHDYFKNKGIFACQKTPNDVLEDDTPSESNLSVPNRYNLIFCDIGNVSVVPKESNLTIIKELLTYITSSQTVIFCTQGLVLSSFWHGILFLISSLFMKMLLIRSRLTTDMYFFILIDCNATPEMVNTLNVYFNCIEDELRQVGDEKEILHVVDLYSLIQSKYRKYMIKRNEVLAQRFVDKVSKLF